MTYNGRAGTCSQDTCCRVSMLGHGANPLNPPSLVPSMPVTVEVVLPLTSTGIGGQNGPPPHPIRRMFRGMSQYPELYWVCLPLLNFDHISVCHSEVSMVPISISTSGLFLYFIKRRDNNAYSNDVSSLQHLQYSQNAERDLIPVIQGVLLFMWNTFRFIELVAPTSSIVLFRLHTSQDRWKRITRFER